ncbi:hypothetical protein IW261DRAFT_659254 [Armillaria novae-zelandiae]|uniref:HMG box domain-containing protein n=1 Tax=Armillaria novae-zelandiae TaxID=153914 RepID=A0AA39NXW7_9AGAR|nr:hypothetical protein IW261DRAFT_659254 [Armillaria novae-zelandiae]
MAPTRSTSVRRSRRLSMQVPVRYDEDGWESSDLATGLVIPIVNDAATHPPPPLATPDAPSKRAKRPPNSFLQFRSTYWRGNQCDRDNRNVSRVCGSLWNAMSAEDRRIYQEMALVARAEHRANNPNGSYKSPPKGKKSTTRRHYGEEGRCRKIAVILREGVETAVVHAKMEMKKEDPVYAIPSPSPTVAAGEERARAPDHATPTAKKEEEEEEFFVPTAAIPPLDLNVAATAKDEFTFDNSVQPPPYVRVDAQFGMNPDVSMDANSESTAPPADDTARAEVFDPVENYLSDYVNLYMCEELDALNDIVRLETESLPFSVDWAYI